MDSSADTAEFLRRLGAADLLVSTGEAGLYARGGLFERVVMAVSGAIAAYGRDHDIEELHLPPVMADRILETSGYLDSFPHLAGIVSVFRGDDADHRALLSDIGRRDDPSRHFTPANLALPPAACHQLYPLIAARGTLEPGPKVVNVHCHCFRSEPSPDPWRMQSFRQQEYVCIGAEAEVAEFRDLWLDKARRFFEAWRLPGEIALANDPFFGRMGPLLAESQRAHALKWELLVPIAADSPTACASFNYHGTKFGQAFDIRGPESQVAHTACVGFGLERIAIALFRHHGFEPERWPAPVVEALGLVPGA